MTKNEQIQNWERFCRQEESFGDGYFYSLLMESQKEDLEEIFKHLPNSEKLVLKTRNYQLSREGNYRQVSINPEQMEILIKLDFEEKKPIFEAHNEFSELLKKWSFVYIQEYDKVIDLIGDDVLSQEFFDCIFNYKINSDDPIYVIDDALYGLTTDFDYRLYIFEALTTLKYTGEYMFQFKNLGGVYAISDNTVYFSYK